MMVSQITEFDVFSEVIY